MSEPRLTAVGAGRRLWLAPELGAWQGALEGASFSASAGRGSLQRARLGSFDAIIRTYRHGGALRGLIPDLFLSARRALSEVKALSRLAPLGFAPRPLVLECRGRLLLRLRIAVEEVPRSRNVLELARDQAERLDTALGRSIGEAVRAMHDAGIAHADLNVGNILVVDGPSANVRLIDFDGATVGDSPVSPEERAREILRLARSLEKWACTAATSAAVRAAFLRAALPLGQRLSVFREACRRSAQLSRLPR